MARILKDRGLTQTRIGRLALSSAAIADVFAWVMLAVVVALAGSGRRNVGAAAHDVGTLALLALVFGVCDRCMRG
jgi:Kef-type K+ transport system membrane component KefB